VSELIADTPRRRVELLCDDPAVNATVSRFAAGERGADLHVHREHTDFFYVLEGELTVLLGPEGERVRVRPGTLARVPPNVIHGFMNAGDGVLRYLNLHAPGMRFADYLRGARDGVPFAYDQFPPPADGGRPITDAVIGGRELLEDGSARLYAGDELTITERTSPGAAEAWAFVLEGEQRWLAPGEDRAGVGRHLEIRAA
jgi:quercetin dioxygenase-like cupin family protein